VFEFGDARIATGGADHCLVGSERNAWRTGSSSSAITGSRLDFWLHALTRAFRESAVILGRGAFLFD